MRQCLKICAAALLAAAWGAPEPAPPVELQPVADVRNLMIGLVDPAADVIWQSVGTIISREGRVDLAPSTDAEWDEVRLAAMVLIESGNLLLVEGRVAALEGWPEFTQGMIATGLETLEAVDARDPDEVLAVGERIYNACVACHETYLRRP